MRETGLRQPQLALAIEQRAQRSIPAHPPEHIVDLIPLIDAEIVFHRGHERTGACAGLSLEVVDVGSGRARDAPVGVYGHHGRQRQQQ